MITADYTAESLRCLDAVKLYDFNRTANRLRDDNTMIDALAWNEKSPV